MGQRWQKKVEQWTALQSGLSAEGAFMSSPFNLFDAETEFFFSSETQNTGYLKAGKLSAGKLKKTLLIPG